MAYKDKEIQRKYQRIWYANRRDEYFKDKTCSNCGSIDRLVLHHVDPEQKASHRIWSWGEERRLKEIEKCVVLCEKCHQKYHNSFRKCTHGKRSTYQKGCRCTICREAERDYKVRRKALIVQRTE